MYEYVTSVSYLPFGVLLLIPHGVQDPQVTSLYREVYSYPFTLLVNVLQYVERSNNTIGKTEVVEVQVYVS